MRLAATRPDIVEALLPGDANVCEPVGAGATFAPNGPFGAALYAGQLENTWRQTYLNLIALLAVTALALILANSSAADPFLAFWKTPVGLRVGPVDFVHSLRVLVNRLDPNVHAELDARHFPTPKRQRRLPRPGVGGG